MNAARFDRLTRTLREVSSRRGLLRGLAGAVGLAAIHAHEAMEAKTKKKLKRNAFGCVNVGGKCRGKDQVCCSGICQGKKPKKGEKDTSRCVAHHEGSCTPEQNRCVSEAGTGCNPANPFALCHRTTGNASFCGNTVVGGCIDCRTDAECQAFGFGPGAACVVCEICKTGETGAETACISAGI